MHKRHDLWRYRPLNQNAYGCALKHTTTMKRQENTPKTHKHRSHHITNHESHQPRLQNRSRSKPESLSEIRFVCTHVLILLVAHSLALVVRSLRTRCIFLSWCPAFVLHVTLCCVAQKIHYKYLENRHMVTLCSFIGISVRLYLEWFFTRPLMQMAHELDCPRYGQGV